MLFWHLPNQIKNYTQKPLHFIARILDQQTSNSLYDHLKVKNWINAISSGLYASSTFFSVFRIEITLTEQGLTHSNDVIQHVYECLHMIRNMVENDRAEWLFHEYAQLNKNSFQWLEKNSPSKYASTLAKRMQHYPANDVLFAPFRMDEFNKKEVLDILDLLTPQNMRYEYFKFSLTK